MVELCVFMLINLLRRVGVVIERVGSSMLPYSCRRPSTTDSSSYDISSESIIDRISYTSSSILFKDFFYSR